MQLKIPIGKISEMADVAEIIQVCGYQIRFICGKRDYEVYRLVEIPDQVTRKAVDQMEGFLKSVDQNVDQGTLKRKEG
jgi:hypothetical protein